MIQPGFAAIGPGGNYGSPTSFGSNNGVQGNNGLHDGNGGGGGGMGNDGNGGQQQNGMVGHDGHPLGPGLNGHGGPHQPEYTLAGILHFLQSEWRKYERDRNEWEIERAEMRARVALLEGERRSVENLKTDLMRRVKMLEFALRHERSKYLASSSNSTLGQAGPPSTTTANAVHPKHVALQNQDKASSSSGRSSPLLDHSTSNAAAGEHGTGTMMSQRGHSTFNSQTFNTLNMGTLNGSVFGGTIGTGGASSMTGANATGANLVRQGTSAKDPKARAKSREYLKQCLQEISYLTNTSTLNPLPERSQLSAIASQGHLRPRKTMPENVPSTFATAPLYQQQQPGTAGEGLAATNAGARRQNSVDRPGSLGVRSSSMGAARGLTAYGETLEEKDEESTMGEEGEKSVSTDSGITPSVQGMVRDDFSFHKEPDTTASVDNAAHRAGEAGSATSDESQDFSIVGDGEQASQHSSTDDTTPEIADEEEREPITAIYRPSDAGQREADDWAKLREAGRIEREKRERERQAGVADAKSSAVSSAFQQPSGGLKADEEDLASLTLASDTGDETSRAAAEAVAEGQMWKSKRVLRGHLDSVRAVVFDKSDLGLYSASDDGTIKYWKLDAASLKQNKPQTQATGSDADPVATLRGHSGAVTCLALSTMKRRLYSGSVDASIVVWKLLDGKNVEPYPPFDRASEVTRLVGHTQPVWDLCILPTNGDEEGLLASASADGTVKIWSTQETQGNAGGQLLLSLDYFGLDVDAKKEAEKQQMLEEKGNAGLPVPTSVSPCMSDLRRVAVAFSNAVVKLFDVQTGKEVMQFASDTHYDGTPATQVNKVITHPTLPILITGHENNYIEFFDMNSGSCTLSMAAHLDSVTSLDIDPSGLTLVSGGHDCSVRFWDIVGVSESVATTISGGTAADGRESSANSVVCVQEITAHRKKSTEGVLVVKYHPNATWFCSAGADSVIRIYG